MRHWSYLTNNQENIFLTFETCEYFDKMKMNYKELDAFEFFHQFEGFTKIFISTKNPTDHPIDDKLFELTFSKCTKPTNLE